MNTLLTLKDFEHDWNHMIVSHAKQERYAMAKEVIDKFYLHIEKECNDYLNAVCKQKVFLNEKGK